MDRSLMLRNTGLDVGTTGTRQVSVGLLWGPAREQDGEVPARSTASVPSDLCTFRRVPLPPAGREVRRRVLREELSFSLPFSLDEAAWDWTDQGGQAWVVVAPLERLGRLRREVGDTASLDAEPLTYLRAALAAGVESALVIDLGASRTTFCGIQDGHLEWVRVMMRGGINLTAQIASRTGMTHPDAERRKCERGMELSECRQMLDEMLEEAFLPSPLPYQKVLLCGGGARMPGLTVHLGEKLGVQPELFPLPDSLSPYSH
ncbi:MAG: pilus assembly protein PilM, partial [Candidatus Eremiobacterota bacterium]